MMTITLFMSRKIVVFHRIINSLKVKVIKPKMVNYEEKETIKKEDEKENA